MNQKGEDVELMTISESTEAAGGLEHQLMEMAARHSEKNQEIGRPKAQFAKEVSSSTSLGSNVTRLRRPIPNYIFE
ncbi:hypothetical protein PGT21_023759 [Puccinia graminis f. sp. tritici]|uniref:Uncharacterized protein n=1 Tax=Puccinia graminis f. sp. tritici TaxID=56615 RepID=A0A5B0MUX7_PUCGR|nr:hypothetical protein PGT21_023759 [Puccinia graminis f. sp. tritici]KAA1137008.1 hypothetical protein PGTUg99_002624 [Puccinia graminis f. sp. tritici]